MVTRCLMMSIQGLSRVLRNFTTEQLFLFYLWYKKIFVVENCFFWVKDIIFQNNVIVML